MALPLSEQKARAATRWLVEHFGDSLRRAVEGTPFSVELLCGIACQETAFLWLPFVKGGATAATVLARSIGDASGDAPNTARSAFPRATAAFRAEYGDPFTNMLIAQADPSKYRAGHGHGGKKGIVRLNAGLWYAHRFDLHNDSYLALCQRLGQVSVTRDGNPPYPDTGMFGINIHKGGYNTMSSLGCQTVHPDQWAPFIELSVDQAKRWHGERWNKVVIPYLLLE